MDMVDDARIAAAGLEDWCKLAQGLHARYLLEDFSSGAQFLVALGEVGAELGHQPTVSMGDGHVDLKLVSDDAVYRSGVTEHIVQWVTQKDLDLAARISEIAADRGLRSDVASVSHVELGLDTARSATIAPVWAALLMGDPVAQGRGTPGDEVRDATGRVPNLWFGDAPSSADVQRFHLEVYVAPDESERRIAAAVAAGATVVDDSEAPGLVVLADQEGNRGVLCAPAPTVGSRD